MFQSRVGIDGDSYSHARDPDGLRGVARFSPVSGLMGIPTFVEFAQTAGVVPFAGDCWFQSRVGIDGDSYGFFRSSPVFGPPAFQSRVGIDGDSYMM